MACTQVLFNVFGGIRKAARIRCTYRRCRRRRRHRNRTAHTYRRNGWTQPFISHYNANRLEACCAVASSPFDRTFARVFKYGPFSVLWIAFGVECAFAVNCSRPKPNNSESFVFKTRRRQTDAKSSTRQETKEAKKSTERKQICKLKSHKLTQMKFEECMWSPEWSRVRVTIPMHNIFPFAAIAQSFLLHFIFICKSSVWLNDSRAVSLNERNNNKKVNCKKMTIAKWMAAVCCTRLSVVGLRMTRWWQGDRGRKRKRPATLTIKKKRIKVNQFYG